ncbi:MAG: cytochrome P450, partial [Chloroflexota bacterium]
LLEHPDQLAKFKADPGLVDGVIAETLRYTTPVQQVAPRIAKEAVEMNGNIILLGESVALFVAAANRDPRMFENPNSFDIARQPNKHLGFGYGAHYCLGAPLARMEGQIAFPMLFARFPEMQLAIPSSDIIWRDAIALRGLKNFPIRLTGD